MSRTVKCPYCHRMTDYAYLKSRGSCRLCTRRVDMRTDDFLITNRFSLPITFGSEISGIDANWSGGNTFPDGFGGGSGGEFGGAGVSGEF